MKPAQFSENFSWGRQISQMARFSRFSSRNLSSQALLRISSRDLGLPLFWKAYGRRGPRSKRKRHKGWSWCKPRAYIFALIRCRFNRKNSLILAAIGRLNWAVVTCGSPEVVKTPPGTDLNFDLVFVPTFGFGFQVSVSAGMGQPSGYDS